MSELFDYKDFERKLILAKMGLLKVPDNNSTDSTKKSAPLNSIQSDLNNSFLKGTKAYEEQIKKNVAQINKALINDMLQFPIWRDPYLNTNKYFVSPHPDLERIYRFDLISTENIFDQLDYFASSFLPTSTASAITKVKESNELSYYIKQISGGDISLSRFNQIINSTKPFLPFYNKIELFRKNILLFRIALGYIEKNDEQITKKDVTSITRVFIVALLKHPLFEDLRIAQQLLKEYPNDYSFAEIHDTKFLLSFLNELVWVMGEPTSAGNNPLWYVESEKTFTKILGKKYSNIQVDFKKELKNAVLTSKKTELLIFIILYNIAADKGFLPQNEHILMRGFYEMGISDDQIMNVVKEISMQ